MTLFLRGLSVAVLVLNALALAVALLVRYGREPLPGGFLFAIVAGGALLAGVLWILAEVCRKAGSVWREPEDDVVGTLRAADRPRVPLRLVKAPIPIAPRKTQNL